MENIRVKFASRPLHRKLRRMLASGVIIDIEKLQEALKHNVGNITFSEAYARTG